MADGGVTFLAQFTGLILRMASSDREQSARRQLAAELSFGLGIALEQLPVLAVPALGWFLPLLLLKLRVAHLLKEAPYAPKQGETAP